MMVRMRTLGGRIGRWARKNLGASCYVIRIKVNGQWYAYMIDIGMEAGDELGLNKGPVEIDKLKLLPMLNGIFITHAHRDHLAAIFLEEVYSRLTPDACIFCTRPTNAFLPWVGNDQLKVSKKRGEKPPYGERDIMKVMGLVRRDSVITRPGYIDLVPGAIQVYVDRAAHMRGASCYYFVITEGKKRVVILFSGDYATHKQGSTLGAPLPPSEDLYPDVVIFDCTNGGEDLTHGKCAEAEFWQREIERMADRGHNTVKAGKTAFYWTFAMDRSQTYASELAKLGLPTYLDGPSAINYGKIMQSGDGFWCEGDVPLDMSDVKICDYVGQPLELGDPCAIVAPSGMCHGPAAGYTVELLGREGNLVAAAGFQAEGTNGYRVVKSKPGDKVRLETGDPEEPFVEVTVAANVDHFRNTGHSLRESGAKRAEVLLSKSKMPTFVCSHGTTGAFNWFERRLSGMRILRIDRERDRDVVLVD